MKKILFLMLLSVLFLKLEYASADVLSCILMVKSHESTYQPCTYDINACKSNCANISLMCGAASGDPAWGGNITILNALYCQSTCTLCQTGETPGGEVTLPPGEQIQGHLDTSDDATGYERMYGKYNLHYGDEGFKECKSDAHPVGDRYCVQIGTDGLPVRGGAGCPGGNQNMRGVVSQDPMPMNGGVVDPMTCRYEDRETPTSSVDIAENAWQNLPVDIRVTIQDIGGSGIGETTSAAGREGLPIVNAYPNNGSNPDGVRVGGGRQSHEKGFAKYLWSYEGTREECLVKGHDLIPTLSRYGTTTTSLQLNVEGEYKLYVCVMDNVGRSKFDEYGSYRYDKTAPKFSEITLKLNTLDGNKDDNPGLALNNPNNYNILANTDSSNFEIIYNEGGTNSEFDPTIGCDEKQDIGQGKRSPCSPLVGLHYQYEMSGSNDNFIESAQQKDVYSKRESNWVSNMEGRTNPLQACPSTENCNLTLDWAVSQIDNDTNTDDGKRVYDSRIRNLCDAAGNCTNKTFAWSLYANEPDWTTTEYKAPNTAYENNFDNTLIADGDPDRHSVVTIRDRYGNKIIPVTDIGRYVEFNTKYFNDNQIDQYNLSGDGGVFFIFTGQNKFSQTKISQTENDDIEYKQICGRGNAPASVNCDKIEDTYVRNDGEKGKYYFRLLSFTPSHNIYSKAFGDTIIKFLESHIDDNDSFVDWPAKGIQDNTKTHINLNTSDREEGLKYRPLFQSMLTGEALVSEGAGNKFKLISNENGGKNKFNNPSFVSNLELMVKYDENPNYEGKISPYLTGGTGINPNKFIQEGEWIPYCVRALKGAGSSFKNFADCNADEKEINTKIRINPRGTGNLDLGAGYMLKADGSNFNGTEVGDINSHFASQFVVGENLSGYHGTVIALWNSDVIGSKGYCPNGDPSCVEYNSLVDQYPIKITGMLGSSEVDKKAAMILQGGSIDGNFGGKANAKYTLTNNVRKKVIELTRGLSTNGSSFNYPINGLTDYNGFKIFYSKGDVTINLNENNTEKFLVIVDEGNAIIKGNIQQGDNGALGIIVLNGGDPNKGNIYLSNVVTNLEAFMYADGGIVTFDANVGITLTQEDMGQEKVNNQLYIKGLLRTSNTLGGSRIEGANPVYKCPLGISPCEKEMAQKYDLYYLRRFHFNRLEEINTTNGERTIIQGWMPFSGGKLIGGIECKNVAGTITCSDNGPNLRNLIPNFNFGESNPFGGISDDKVTKYTDYLGPIIIEYDPKVKTFNVPIFSSEI